MKNEKNSIMTSLTFPKKLHVAVKEDAKKKGVSMSRWMQAAFESYLKDSGYWRDK